MRSALAIISASNAWCFFKLFILSWMSLTFLKLSSFAIFSLSSIQPSAYKYTRHAYARLVACKISQKIDIHHSSLAAARKCKAHMVEMHVSYIHKMNILTSDNSNNITCQHQWLSQWAKLTNYTLLSSYLPTSLFLTFPASFPSAFSL